MPAAADWITLTEASEILKAANAPIGLHLQPNASGFGASDQTSFYSRDIPVLFFFTGSHAEYHKPSDTADKINAPGEAKVLALVADCLMRIAAFPEPITVVRKRFFILRT